LTGLVDANAADAVAGDEAVSVVFTGAMRWPAAARDAGQICIRVAARRIVAA
jgi:hypothetical protein